MPFGKASDLGKPSQMFEGVVENGLVDFQLVRTPPLKGVLLDVVDVLLRIRSEGEPNR